MKNTSTNWGALMLPAITAMVGSAGCEGDDDQKTPALSVVQTVGARSDLASLAELLEVAGLEDVLAQEGPFTIFAPRNAAFAALPAGSIDALKGDPAALAELLKYHVVSGRLSAADLASQAEVSTLAGGKIALRLEEGRVTLTDAAGAGAAVIDEDVFASNGVVHVIGRVLTPKEEIPVTGQSLVEVAAAGGFSSLVGALDAAGLTDALAGPGPLTVFAPTNAAFEAAASILPTSPALVANVLLHHVVAGRLGSADVLGQASLTSLAGTSLSVEAGATPTTVGGAPLAALLDVTATNGVVHAVDAVMVPPTVLQAASATPALSALVGAVGEASDGVREALAGGPITVFAPINSAFEALPEGALAELVADQTRLDALLSYHVVQGQRLSTSLEDGVELTTLQGGKLRVVVRPGGAFLEDVSGARVSIVSTDLRLLNGVVHLVSSVLSPDPPPPGNIVEVATQAGSFTTLLGLAVRTGLDAALVGPGPLTVFAPGNDAFDALGVDLAPVADDVVANILLHHVVGSRVESRTLSPSSQLSSLANLDLAVGVEGTALSVGGARVGELVDVEASNGLVHVLDQVIVPPTILEIAAGTEALSTLVSAVALASDGVQDALAPKTLTGDAPITVFAPTNAAFEASGIDLDALLQATLDGVLGHHAVVGQVLSGELSDGQTVAALNGTLTVRLGSGGEVRIEDGQGRSARVVRADLRTLTGVVHVIESVLLP